MSHRYLDNIQKAIINFQFIEESLRMYISIAYEIVKKQSKDYFPFKFSYQDLEKDSMGKLVDKFEKFSTNSDLVGDLRKIIPLRNLVTHRGLLLKDGEIDNELLNKDIESIVERSKNCLDKLMIEWKKIQVLSKTITAPNTG